MNFITVTFQWGDQSFIGRYKIVNGQITLISITPPSSQYWCPPKDAWGFANKMKPHVLRVWHEKERTENFVFDTQFCNTKDLIGSK